MKLVSYQHVQKIKKTTFIRLNKKYFEIKVVVWPKNIYKRILSPVALGPPPPPPQGKIYVHTPVLHPKSTKYLYIFIYTHLIHMPTKPILIHNSKAFN